MGRSVDADVPLDDPDVSRLHCAVTVETDGRVTVADLGSTNGTSVDGGVIGPIPVPLTAGALLRIGESALRVRPSPAAAGAPGAERGAGSQAPSPDAPGGFAPSSPDILPALPDGDGHLRVAVRTGDGPDSGQPGVAEGAFTPPRGVDAAHPAQSAPARGGPLPGGPLPGGPLPGGPLPGDSGAAPAYGLAPGGFPPPPAARVPVPGGQRDGGRRQSREAQGPARGSAPAAPDDAYGSRRATPLHGTPPPPGLPPAAAAPERPGPGADATHVGQLPLTGPETEAAEQSRRAARRGGIGAWARRLTGGRADADGEEGCDQSGAPGAPWPDSHGLPGTGAPGAPGAFAPDHRLGASGEPDAAGRPGDWAGDWAGDEAAHAHHISADSSAPPERWPDPAAVLLTALGPGPRLWERGARHPDAMTLRLGTTDRPANPYTAGPHSSGAQTAGPNSGGSRVLAPVTVDLRRAGALGLAGPRARLAGLARSVLAQLAALHPPTILEIALISTDRSRPTASRLAEWAWLGWLPQLRPAHGQDTRLLLAYDREQATARTAELMRRLDDGPLGPSWASADRAMVQAAAERHTGPRTVVLVDGDPGSPALRETVSLLAAGGPSVGIHLICLAETPAASPLSPLSATYEAARAASPAFAACGAVAVLSGDVATGLHLMRQGRAAGPGPGAGDPTDAAPPALATTATTTVATVDAVSAAWAERFARALAPLREADSTAAGGHHYHRAAIALPRTSRLLDELGLARATPASLLARWSAAADAPDAVGGRAAAVLGAGPHGPLCVDLAADGPHLLLDGGPAVGKTELLRSVAASLAAAERPDRLALVLVDGYAASPPQAGEGTQRGEGLRMCTDLPHVSTYLAASDPVRMREFAQALSAELKRRAELLAGMDFTEWHASRLAAARVIAPRRSPDPVLPPRPAPSSGGAASASQGAAPGTASGAASAASAGSAGSASGAVPAPEQRGDLESASSGTLKLRARNQADAPAPLPRLVVLVDDFDALVAPALGSTGRPSAGSVVRALEAVAREGARLGVHLIAATGHPDRTAATAAAQLAGLRVTLDGRPTAAESETAEALPGRGRLTSPDGSVTPFQAGRVTGRIPRTATLRPTVVGLDWERMGDPPTRRPLRELGNGPTDLALLASAVERAAQSSAAAPAAPLL
ncbi:FHA domain-containing protein [Streptomyces sp. H27-D2]|uniref:FHA domain-containing protein n=1 Tax=Streptomyces sp. H27-D2 TaxID=3046304 RepID=UPI003FA77B16